MLFLLFLLNDKGSGPQDNRTKEKGKRKELFDADPVSLQLCIRDLGWKSSDLGSRKNITDP